MGMIGESLASQIKQSDLTHSFYERSKRDQGVGIVPKGVRDIQELVNEGMDPIHAVYALMQQLTSVFAEQMSSLTELRAYGDIVGPAEEEYMPSGPPMSPLTGSYFTCWAFFDCRFGPDQETIGTCFLDIISQVEFPSDHAEFLRRMQNSRMGIYEQLENQGKKVLLQELMTQERFVCHVPTGYRGKPGQLWMVRLMPPIENGLGYHIVFTTPYILIGETREDWIAFFKRNLPDKGNIFASYCDFMKYGKDLHYWNEYIFQAYHHPQQDAIFLAGLPDVRSSLPHANPEKYEFGKPTGKKRKRT